MRVVVQLRFVHTINDLFLRFYGQRDNVNMYSHIAGSLMYLGEPAVLTERPHFMTTLRREHRRTTAASPQQGQGRGPRC